MKAALGDVPAWAALLVSIGAIWVATRANRHAKESAAASKRSADAAERQAAAAEQALAPPPPRVKWRISHGKGREEYVLRNVGDATATGVQVDQSRLPRNTDFDLGDGVFRPGRSVSIWAILMGGDDAFSEIWLTWDGQDEPVAVPLP